MVLKKDCVLVDYWLESMSNERILKLIPYHLVGTTYEFSTMPTDQVQYSEKYYDPQYEYRHVIVCAELAKRVPKTHLMSESEWRNLGVQQSPGWVHYMMHSPEPHVLLFRRLRTDIPGAKISISVTVS